MSQLILEFPLDPGAVTLAEGKLYLALGNGVHMTTTAPPWLKSVVAVKLSLIMEVQGSPADDKSKPTPIK